MTTLMVATPCPFRVRFSATAFLILDGVGIPGQELKCRRGTRPRSKDVVPVHEQDGQSAETGRRDAHDQMVGDPPSFGEVGERPVEREQDGEEPWDRKQRATGK